MAWVSFGLFASLMIAAMYEYAIVRPRTQVAVALPHNTLLPVQMLDMVQLDCMAQNVFFEARGESANGKMMVAMVVLERTMSPHFPSTVCGVVHQANLDADGYPIKYQCSFSWVCDGEKHDIDFTNDTVAKEWEQSYTIAKLVMLGALKPKLDMEGVTHYHANYVKPFWIKSKNYKLVARVGDHLFYRWSKATLPKLNVASI
jgi:spore germination cell wall hydrolase CwlJ-like protein